MDNRINKTLGKHWGMPEARVPEILDMLEAREWSGGHLIESCRYAGVIDNDDYPDKTAGHSGYWIASEHGQVCYTFNGDCIWGAWTQETQLSIEVEAGDFDEVMKPYAVKWEVL
jgi:hypothetical protein